MTLTFVVVAAAGLVSSRRLPVQLAFFSLGAVPALLTGVRSALLALFVVILIYCIRVRFDRRAWTVIVAIVARRLRQRRRADRRASGSPKNRSPKPR